MRSIAVIGGGYAGMAAAVELAEAGCAVTVFEAGRVLGGRARRLVWQEAALDNGQHLLLGAYRQTLRLIDKVAPRGGLYRREKLALVAVDGAALRLPRWPYPLDGALGFFAAQGLSWAEKWAALRLMAAVRRELQVDEPLAAFLARWRQPARLTLRLWEPLCLAALNTPLATASAQMFARVLRDSLLGGAGASDAILPQVDLSALFPEPAAEFVRQRGGAVHTGCRIAEIQTQGTGYCVAGQVFEQVIVAVAPQHAASLLAAHDPQVAAGVSALSYQPIASVWLQYPPACRLPQPMVGLQGRIGQWVFDRGQLTGESGYMAVVISAEGPHQALSREALIEQVAAELTAIWGWPSPLAATVVTERRATFAAECGVQRAPLRTAARGLWLAGDHVAGHYPATLEGAVQSGVAAARAALASP